jgi:D-amino-acid dehydrogenase
VAPSPADRDAFEAELERVRARGERVGYPDPEAVRELAPEAARERFPALGDVDRAYVYENAARVDGRRFADALRRAGANRGLEERDATVERVRVDGGEATGVVADGERIDADAVVVAGGAWSGAFADDLGVSVPVEPQRGELVHLAVEDAGAEAWPMLSRVGGHYVVPWVDGRVIAGASRGPVGDDDVRQTAGGVHEALTDALAMAPGLADAGVREVRVGLRPVTPDGRPALGGVPGVEGAYLATGHGPNGLHLGPYSGRLLAERVRGDGGDVPALFDPGRFA